ncbi:hypothetical protein EUGRSUZ_B02028 [Eucalyptus grandis]|uniref:Uncharacterized protein n=2 Tax=Eucalyptus grandis TaxID=71139 RepID=A0ACC3LRL5_EUCGR|nr:hypothetical protein EUGRSUZ_B02028 [Eucalyptus grandis]
MRARAHRAECNRPCKNLIFLLIYFLEIDRASDGNHSAKMTNLSRDWANKIPPHPVQNTTLLQNEYHKEDPLLMDFTQDSLDNH